MGLEKVKHTPPAGMILEIKNLSLRVYASLCYLPFNGVDIQQSLFENRSRSGVYFHMKYREIIINGKKWIEEISDYKLPEKKLKYYTMATNHKGRLIIFEAYSKPENFERMIPFFQKAVRAIVLF